jgi:hypothetical protein
MLLQPDEKVVLTETLEASIGGATYPGTLYLTDRRLVFEGKVSSGLLSTAIPTTMVDVGLHSISNLMVHAPVVGRPLLQVESWQGRFSFRTRSATQWRDQITTTRSALGSVPRPPPPPPPRGFVPPPPPPPTNQPVVIHLHQDNANPSVYLHCRHCGTLNPSGSTRCTSCGAAL